MSLSVVINCWFINLRLLLLQLHISVFSIKTSFCISIVFWFSSMIFGSFSVYIIRQTTNWAARLLYKKIEFILQKIQTRSSISSLEKKSLPGPVLLHLSAWTGCQAVLLGENNFSSGRCIPSVRTDGWGFSSIIFCGRSWLMNKLRTSVNPLRDAFSSIALCSFSNSAFSTFKFDLITTPLSWACTLFILLLRSAFTKVYLFQLLIQEQHT